MLKQYKDICVPAGQVYVWYTGQMGFVFKTADISIVTDLYLTDSIDRQNHFSPEFTRCYPPPASPEEMAGADIVLCTHGHDDHMDEQSLKGLAGAPDTIFIAPETECEKLSSCGIKNEKMISAQPGNKIAVNGCEIHPVLAKHEIEGTPESALSLSYVLKFSCGITIFYGGDMVVYKGLPKAVAAFKPDIAVMPVNGRGFDREWKNIIGNTDAREAIEFTKMIGAKIIIPAHYDLYKANNASPSAFVEMLGRLAPEMRHRLFIPGECMVFTTVCGEML